VRRERREMNGEDEEAEKLIDSFGRK